MNQHPNRATMAIRAVIVALLVFTTAAVAVETFHVPANAIAKNGKSGKSGKGNGNGHDNGNGHGKGHKDDKATKQAKKHEDKENRGKGKGKGTKPIVIAQAPNTTPVVATPAPTVTAAPAAIGTLLVHTGRCGATPVANAEWTNACATPVLGARYELAALDGPLSGWTHELTSDANGTATLDGLPPGRYDLTRLDGSWCHAESDRVDASGELVVTAGQTTTVWIAVCR